jgi:hypothetical protein
VLAKCDCDCLGRRVASYAIRDAKEIAKLLEMVGGLLIRRRELSRFWAMPSVVKSTQKRFT